MILNFMSIYFYHIIKLKKKLKKITKPNRIHDPDREGPGSIKFVIVLIFFLKKKSCCLEVFIKKLSHALLVF